MVWNSESYLISFYTMDKLTWLETIEAEKQEKKRARQEAKLQEQQRQKRLWYFPIIWERIVLIGAVTIMYWIVFLSWFVTWDAQEKTEPQFLLKTICELPETGANW